MSITFDRSVCIENENTTEIEKLQSKYNGVTRSHIRSSNLSRLQSILDKSHGVPLPALDSKKINIAISCNKNVQRAIMAILSFQRWVPNQMDIKNFSEVFAKLFAHLSVEMYKLEGVDKKLARQKLFHKKIIEKSEKGKKMGK